jgi:exopolysaccharide production protein ExoZ
MVVAFHAPATIAAFSGSIPLLRAGAYGVDIFFVISGFIMGTAGANGGSERTQFVLKRLVRIVPLYWATTILTAALALMAPRLMRSTVVDVETVVKSLLFIPHFSHAHAGHIWPLVVPGWTLNYELFFYALVAVVIPFATKTRALFISIVFLALVCIGSVFQPVSAIYLTYTNSLLLEFVLGLWIAIAYQRGRLPDSLLAWVMIICGLVALAYPDSTLRGITKGIPAAAIVYGALVVFRNMKTRVIERIGDASYSIYLTQFFSFGIVRGLWSLSGIHSTSLSSAVLYVAASLAGCVIVGLCVYVLVERPITKSLNRLIGRCIPLASGTARTQTRPIGPLH